MQEIDIPVGYDCYLLSFKGYNLITEKNNVKSRTGLYIKNGINYSRRSDLEGLNNGLIIIDVLLKSKYRIFGVYRVFNPPGAITQRQYFSSQIDLIKTAAEECGEMKLIILGDFNLNENMKYQQDYSHKAYYEENKTLFDSCESLLLWNFNSGH